jgi:hypothetical protein
MKTRTACACLSLFACMLTAVTALGQTYTNETNGSLAYVMETVSEGTCPIGSPGGTREPITAYNYYNFVYAGQALGGGATYLVSPGGLYCPANGPTGAVPLVMTGTGVTVDFYSCANNSGCSVTVTNSASGYINPKFVILGVTYAPPGPSSYVQYSNSTLVGNTTSLGSSFSSQSGLSVSISSGIQAGKNGAMVSGTTTTAYTQQSNSSSSVSVSQTNTQSDKTPGPISPYIGVDHDYDYVWVWVNPLVRYTVTGNPNNPDSANLLQWNGYAYDQNDPCQCMDVFGIWVGYLNGDFGPMPSNDAVIFQRAWAGANGEVWASGQGPALTTTDFQNVMQSDPYWQCGMASHPLCPTTVSGTRYTLTNDNQNIVYEQAPPNGQAGTQMYTDQYTTTSTQGQGAMYTFQQAFSFEQKFSAGFFILSVTYDLKESETLTWTTQYNKMLTQTSTETGVLSVTGPPCTAGTNPCNPLYTGPTEFDVYEDNLYGTFLFNAAN